ncbi:MAG: LPXTG cell wall anchor domain-containing protein [Actinomycetota bacterium]
MMSASQRRKRRIARGTLALMALCVVGILGSMMLFAGSASAKRICDPYTHKCKTISPTRFTTSPPHHSATTTTVEPPSPTPTVLHKQVLPFTGADVTLFVLTGLAAIGIGFVIVRRTRTRKQES